MISPILANIYLHYAFDLWSHVWRQKRASGDVIVIRYADDIVLGFQYEREARAFLQDLQTRLRRFELALHPKKTRLIRFGRHAAEQRRRLGQGKPETVANWQRDHPDVDAFEDRGCDITSVRKISVMAQNKRVKEALMAVAG